MFDLTGEVVNSNTVIIEARSFEKYFNKQQMEFILRYYVSKDMGVS